MNEVKLGRQNLLGTNVATQIAVVVRDIDKAIDAYSELLGVPKPNVIITDPDAGRDVYRGKSTRAQAKLAFFELGQVSLELIEPVGTDSVWYEVLAEKGEGVHHIAFNIQGTGEVTASLADHGMPVIQQGHYTGGMYTYVDSEAKLGVMLELLENFDAGE
jgi:4-hydroxyphenylpyruvate dioxygenase-like putative hemolysin